VKNRFQGQEKNMARKKQKSNGAVEKKLVGVADVVITAAQRSQDPALSIPVRSLANVNFNEKRGIIEMGRRKQARTFFNVGMAKKFMQTVLVADALAELQRANLTTSLREIYYRTKHTIKNSHENTFDGQNESDPLIEDLEVTLEALREELHVRAENSGTVVGPLTLVDDGDRVLGAGIVRRQDDNIAELHRHASHFGALASIPIMRRAFPTRPPPLEPPPPAGAPFGALPPAAPAGAPG